MHSNAQLRQLVDRLQTCQFVTELIGDDVVVALTSDACPACVRFKKNRVPQLRRELRDQGLRLQLVDLDTAPLARGALSSIGQRTIPALISRRSVNGRLAASKTWRGVYYGSP